MKKTLSVITLIAAGAACATAGVYPLSFYFGGAPADTATHDYERIGSTWAINFQSYGNHKGITNRGTDRDRTRINLGEDARYEINFELTWYSGSQNNHPIFNIYLSDNEGKSLLFGNYYMENESGQGRMYTYNGGISGGSTSGKTYLLDSKYKNSSGWNWQSPIGNGQYITALADGKPEAEKLTYRISIESYADANIADRCRISINNSANEFDLKILDIAHDAIFENLGYFSLNDGGSVIVSQNTSGIFKYSRKKIPQVVAPPPPPPPPPLPPAPPTPPTLEPSLPEPSSFSLLAGLGALCLAGSRRRRDGAGGEEIKERD